MSIYICMYIYRLKHLYKTTDVDIGLYEHRAFSNTTAVSPKLFSVKKNGTKRLGVWTLIWLDGILSRVAHVPGVTQHGKHTVRLSVVATLNGTAPYV